MGEGRLVFRSGGPRAALEPERVPPPPKLVGPCAQSFVVVGSAIISSAADPRARCRLRLLLRPAGYRD